MGLTGVFALPLPLLLLCCIPFSIAAAVGFIARSGLSLLKGLVMTSAIREHRAEGEGDGRAMPSVRWSACRLC
jgi:Cu/Ag efflux pump CusA